MQAIFDYTPWVLRKGGHERKVVVEGSQVSGKRLVVQLQGVDSRDLADQLIGYEIHVDRQTLPELGSGAYYWFQLEGLKVRNVKGVVFGQVDHLLETGANDVMVVQPTSDSVDDQQRLIPYVEDEVIKQVDQETGEILVDWEVEY